MISPFYGINPAQAENPYFFLYLFQDLNDVQMSWKFTGIIILEGGRPRSKRSKLTEAGGGKRGCPTRPGTVAMWAHLFWPSWPRLRRSFALKHPRDLKMPIKRVPRHFPEGGGGETQNQKQRDRRRPPEKIGGGETPPESLPKVFSIPPPESPSTPPPRPAPSPSSSPWSTSSPS